MLLLRIEDDMGLGPWTGRKYPFDGGGGDYDHFSAKERPAPGDDVGGKHDKKLVCALHKFDLYDHWFRDHHRNNFVKKGYKASVYKIHKNSVKIGTYQSVFKKSKAKLVAQFDATDLDGIKKCLDK